MADQFKVTGALVYLRYHDPAGAVVQGTFYQGAVVTAVEDEGDPIPGQVVRSGPGSIDHHLETEQLVPLDDPVADVFGPAGTPLPGHAPNVELNDGGDPVIVEEPASKLQRVRKATPGIPDEPPKGSPAAKRQEAQAEAERHETPIGRGAIGAA